MAKLTLAAEERTAAGKNQVDKLRRTGLVPAVVYTRGEDSENIQVDALAFNKVYQEAGTSRLIDLDLGGGKKKTVLIQEIQKHPYRDIVLHVDFHEVAADEEVRVVVPVILLGRDAIKVQPSVLVQLIDELEVETLPAYIPESATVDVTEMQLDDVLTVADLDIAHDEHVHILAEADDPVAALNAPEAEEAPQEAEEGAEAADVPEVGKEEEAGSEE